MDIPPEYSSETTSLNGGTTQPLTASSSEYEFLPNHQNISNADMSRVRCELSEYKNIPVAYESHRQSRNDSTELHSQSVNELPRIHAQLELIDEKLKLLEARIPRKIDATFAKATASMDAKYNQMIDMMALQFEEIENLSRIVVDQRHNSAIMMNELRALSSAVMNERAQTYTPTTRSDRSNNDVIVRNRNDSINCIRNITPGQSPRVNNLDWDFSTLRNHSASDRCRKNSASSRNNDNSARKSNERDNQTLIMTLTDLLRKQLESSTQLNELSELKNAFNQLRNQLLTMQAPSYANVNQNYNDNYNPTPVFVPKSTNYNPFYSRESFPENVFSQRSNRNLSRNQPQSQRARNLNQFLNLKIDNGDDFVDRRGSRQINQVKQTKTRASQSEAAAIVDDDSNVDFGYNIYDDDDREFDRANSFTTNDFYERDEYETSSNALNNQVTPGSRANNFVDNFRSHSQQNIIAAGKMPRAPSFESLSPTFATASLHSISSRSSRSNAKETRKKPPGKPTDAQLLIILNTDGKEGKDADDKKNIDDDNLDDAERNDERVDRELNGDDDDGAMNTSNATCFWNDLKGTNPASDAWD